MEVVSQAKRRKKKKKKKKPQNKTFPKIKPTKYPFLFWLIFSLLFKGAPVMEGRGEGGGRGACGNENSQNNPPLYRPGPPLTAIDRFLYEQNHFSQQQAQNYAKNKEVLVSDNGLFSFVDEFFVDGEPLNWMHERNPNMDFKEEVKAVGKNSKSVAKKAKKCSSEALIKGQWTDEEDR
jgi:myb proto-oncogene protein